MSTELNQRNKKMVWNFRQALQSAGGDTLDAVAGKYLADEHAWHGPDPINDLPGVERAWSRDRIVNATTPRRREATGQIIRTLLGTRCVASVFGLR